MFTVKPSEDCCRRRLAIHLLLIRGIDMRQAISNQEVERETLRALCQLDEPPNLPERQFDREVNIQSKPAQTDPAGSQIFDIPFSVDRRKCLSVGMQDETNWWSNCRS